MSWLIIRQFLSRVLLWVKQHWEFVLGIIVAISVMMFFSRGKKVNLSKVLDSFRTKNKKEVDDIVNSQEKERVEVEKIRKKTELTIIAVEEKFKEESLTLDKKKKREVEKIVAENKGIAPQKRRDVGGIEVAFGVDI